jgi:hypothetical protein
VVEPGPAPEPSKLLARCTECRPSGRQATHEVATPRRPCRARERTAVPHVMQRWSPMPRVARPKSVRPPWAGTPAGLPGWSGGSPGARSPGGLPGRADKPPQ